MKPTTTLYHNANILTGARSSPRATAMAVTGGRISAIGDLSTVGKTVSPDAQQVDLQGAHVMPGMIDIHNHHEMAGRSILYETLFPPSLDFDGILSLVRKAAETTPAGRWVVGESFGSHHLPRMDSLEALKQLDDAGLGRPVLLRDDSHHNRWVNTAAMRAAGVDEQTPFSGVGGIAKDAATGRLTGVFMEDATQLVDRVMEDTNYADPALHLRAVQEGIAVLNAHGVTAIQDAQTFHDMLVAVSDLDRQGGLNAWVVASLPIKVFMYQPGPIGIELFEMKERFRTRHVRPDFAKFVLDGVPTNRTAALLEPYRPTPATCCYRGGATLTLPQFARLLAECERHGLAAKIHCAGDGAARLALDGIEVVRNFEGRRPSQKRHQIAHATLLGAGDVQRMAALDVVADMSPVLWYPGLLEQALRHTLPDELVDNLSPIRDMVEAGVLVTGGTDWPVCPFPNVWDGFEGMVTRANPEGSADATLGKHQAIDAATALQVYTLNSAEALGLDTETGSLEPGKSADFIIVDQDVLAIEPRKIAKTRVLSTWFEGRKVFEL
jgi:predicted amidohydrolase YtcJ